MTAPTMPLAPAGTGFTPTSEDSPDAEAIALAALQWAEHERHTRSPRMMTLATLGAALLFGLASLLPAAPGEMQNWLGELTAFRLRVLVVLVWGPFILAGLAFRIAGPSHWDFRLCSAIDQVCRTAGLIALLVLSSSAAVLFLLASMTRGFAWQPITPKDIERTIVLQVAAHGLAAVACLVIASPVHAALVVLASMAYALARMTSGGASWRALKAQVERDRLERALLGSEVAHVRHRIAREIHDGVGADTMALMLNLRRAALSDADAVKHADAAQRVLEDLRTLVWSLKGDEGTLAELAKLIDAKCARLCPGSAYQRSRSPAPEEGSRIVRAANALKVLTLAPRLIQIAAMRARLTWVRVKLRADESVIEITVEADGAATPQSLTAETTLFTEAREITVAITSDPDHLTAEALLHTELSSGPVSKAPLAPAL